MDITRTTATEGPKPSGLRSPGIRLFAYWFCGFGVLLGVGLQFTNYRIAGDASDYVETRGTVIESRLNESHSNGPDLPEIVFGYRVDGVDYEDKLVPSHGIAGKEEWSYAQLVEAHPVGTSVTVYYDPDDPSSAILTRDPLHHAGWGALILYAVLLALLHSRVRKALASVPPLRQELEANARENARVRSEAQLRRARKWGLLSFLFWPLAFYAWELRARGLDDAVRGGIQPHPAAGHATVLVTVALLVIPLSFVFLGTQ